MADENKRVQVGPVTLGWGDPRELKADLRDEDIRRFQELSLSERIVRVLEMTARKTPNDHSRS